MFHLLQALLVALAVAIDAATVAACEGISRGCKRSWATLATIALLFGVLQGGVTAIGYCLGAETIDFIDEYDHWVVLVLLVAVGGHMIYDAFARAADQRVQRSGLYTYSALLFLFVDDGFCYEY